LLGATPEPGGGSELIAPLHAVKAVTKVTAAISGSRIYPPFLSLQAGCDKIFAFPASNKLVT
jgi:hypothetical protein